MLREMDVASYVENRFKKGITVLCDIILSYFLITQKKRKKSYRIMRIQKI